jgi:glycosyltransferase involved in cell wall biosynthesis
MRIALDARTIYARQRRGMGKSLVLLYRALAEVRPEWEVIAYHRWDEPLPDLLPEGFVQPRLIEMPGDRFEAWQHWRLPLAAWRDGADLLHCPANHCPRWMPLPTVVTIHDLIPLDLQEARDPVEVKRFEQSVRRACQRAAGITCPSQYTRSRLLAEWAVASDRVHVTPWAATEPLEEIDEAAVRWTMLKYELSGPYVLHFGAGEARKNTRRMIEAWALVSRQWRRNWKLLVVGLDGPTRGQMEKTCERLGVSESVLLQGFADEADLAALLAGAEVLAYPSLSEGFGLPVLEAFAAGTAVLTSNRTSLPEVAGDAAVLVEPEDSCGIAQGLGRLMKDSLLRFELGQRGRKRAGEYSWPCCAERFARAIEDTAKDLVRLRKAS